MATGDTDTTRPLIGRAAELARVDEAVAAVRASRGAALVVRGAAGTGKTALLEHAGRQAGDRRVVCVRGVADEVDLPYSALHLLCSALQPHLPGLDQRDRETLETALGVRTGPAPDRLAVGVAVLAFLSVAAQVRPVLCLVDDTHLLDDASASVLAFVARRVATVPVGVLLAGRGEGFSALPAIDLGALGHAAARALLRGALPGSVDPAVVERVVAESGGNPRTLLSAARAARHPDFAGGYGVPPVDGTSGPELPELTAESRLLLLLAAAEPLGDPNRFRRAAARLGVVGSASERLETSAVLGFGQWVTFREPGLRSAVYAAGAAADRRRVHAALAAVTDAAVEPDRRAWHLGHATPGPDEALAVELGRCADTARGRAGFAAAATFLQRSALLTADPARRAERFIAAADAHHVAGAPEPAERLLAATLTQPITHTIRVRTAALRARIGFDAGPTPAAVEALIRSARQAGPGTPPDRDAGLDAAAAALFAGVPTRTDTTQQWLADWLRQADDPVLDGLRRWCADDYPAAAETVKLALKASEPGDTATTRARLVASVLAPGLWDIRRWEELTTAQAYTAARTGAVRDLRYALADRALTEIHLGRLDAAEVSLRAADDLATGLGAPRPEHVHAVVSAWRGDDLPIDPPGPHRAGEGVQTALLRYACAVRHNGRGAYREALDATRHTVADGGSELFGWSLAELVEAAVRSGERQLAAVALDRLVERTSAAGTDWALGVEARSRALVTEGRSAERSHRAAIELLERSGVATDLARAQLLYGEWLRRGGRRVEARNALRAAQHAFSRMGAGGFAERAGRELTATGERARRRVPETRTQLTPQENWIAALARDGKSNPDIARQLSISSRTVEYHLHKVFAKLGITARAELRQVLTEHPV